MQTLSQIKAILETRCLAPKRSLGQNFLTDHNLIRKLVDSAELSSTDLVLEVGPGTGTMTEELLSRGVEVIACELDNGLAAHLTEHFAAQVASGTFTLIHDDCLAGKHALNPKILAGTNRRPFKLVANLPYGAGTPLMSTLLIDHPECSTLAVTIQREVADRLLASPGTKDYGALAVIAQAAAEISRVATAPPECFWPRPDITSSMVLLRRRAKPLGDLPKLSDFCRTIFAQRRKQLGSLLPKTIDWPVIATKSDCANISPTLRAEQLAPHQIISLMNALPRPG